MKQISLFLYLVSLCAPRTWRTNPSLTSEVCTSPYSRGCPPTTRPDNRPQPKPRFAAVSAQPPQAKAATHILPLATAGNPTVGPGRGRPSLVPVSRVPRASSIGIANSYQPFTLNHGAAVRNRRGVSRQPSDRIVEESDNSGSIGLMLTEKEIDERVWFYV